MITKLMTDKSIDVIVLGSQKNIYYLTGYITEKLFLPYYLFVFGDGEAVLVTGKNDRDKASQSFGGEIVDYVDYDINSVMRPYHGMAVDAAGKLLEKRKNECKTIGFEGWGVDSALFHELTRVFSGRNFVDVSANILSMRQSKDRDELAALRKAAELNDYAYQVAFDQTHEGRTEVEVYAATHAALAKKVGGFQFFAGDFVSGERCVNIGGPPTERKLRKGETFILDLWVVREQYWSDLSRTFIVDDRLNDLQRKVFEVLEDALKAGEDVLRPGVTGAEVYRAVYKAIEKHGYGKHFPHHAGHGLGLEAWEPPYFIPGDKTAVTENTVCTLEPGIYFKELGGVRLENNYIVRKDGVEVLNKFPLMP